MNTLDTEVIKRIQNGEIEQFSVLVGLYTGKIRSYIHSKLFDKHDVDDLVQNSFLSFYKAIDRFDATRPALPYLYEIARNEMKMYFRAKKLTVSLDEAVYVIDDKNTEHEVQDTDQVLSALSGEQKKALEWIYEGYSYEEISKKLKRPLNTVRTIIRRARLKVIKLYGEKT